MDNCACAWAQVFPEYPRFRVYHHIRQIAWCRLHMEAEIAKQGQAAGADVSKDSGSPSPTANVAKRAKESESGDGRVVNHYPQAGIP